MEYLNEQQQVDQIKTWLKEYGVSILVGVVFAILIVLSLRYYQRYRYNQSEEASFLYTTFINGVLSQQHSAADDAANSLISKYKHTPYASFAELWLAKENIDQQNYSAADKQLDVVIEHSEIAALRQIARIRKAQIALQQHQPTGALSILTTIDDDAYRGLVDEVRGDAYLRMNQPDNAREHYQLALKEIPQSTLAQPTLAMKLADLPVVAPHQSSGK